VLRDQCEVTRDGGFRVERLHKVPRIARGVHGGSVAENETLMHACARTASERDIIVFIAVAWRANNGQMRSIPLACLFQRFALVYKPTAKISWTPNIHNDPAAAIGSSCCGPSVASDLTHFKNPLSFSQSIKIISTSTERGRLSFFAAFASAAFTGGSTLAPRGTFIISFRGC
jgi:hypothetical protein